MFEYLWNPDAILTVIVDKGEKFLLSVIILVVAYFLIKLLDKMLGKLFDKTEWDVALEKFLQSLANGIAWIVVFLIILTVFEVDIGPMIASLGIVGFVLGFALKDTLGNLASGVMLLIYKPFTVGHFVEVDGQLGTIRSVGISACQMDTPDNKRITIPNSGVWGNPIINYSANKTRRIDVSVGISYNDDIGKAVQVAQKLLKKDDLVLNDPEPVVAVDNLGDSSVNLTLRFWVKRQDYMGQKWGITRAIKEEYDNANISIPFPQRDIHIVSEFHQKTKKTVALPSRTKMDSKKYSDDDDQ